MNRNTIRAFALGIITGSFLTSGTLLLATPAKADPSNTVVQYAIDHEGLICSSLAELPTVARLQAILNAEMNIGGLTPYEAGQATALAVMDVCPEFTPVLQRYINLNGGSNSIAANKIGGKIA